MRPFRCFQTTSIRTASANYQGTGTLYLGKWSSAYYLHGSIDEVRIWNIARDAKDIKANVLRYLGGQEPGLTAYYHLENADANDRSGNGHHSTLHGNLTSRAPVASPLKAYTCFASVGNDAIATTEAIVSHSWHHFAAVYNQSMLNISEDLTIETFVKLDTLGRKHGIVCKGIMDNGGEGSGQAVSRNMSAAIAGNWDVSDKTRWANPDLPRRFIPTNRGFAFVESETADIYALRLEHNGALVAFRMLPNLDIPKDTNIIPFPINNRYCKQGTLDGRIGYTSSGIAIDPDYANATGYGEYSYFKPKEAYELKKCIEQEAQRLKKYYDNFDAMPAGAGMMGSLAGITGGVVGGISRFACWCVGVNGRGRSYCTGSFRCYDCRRNGRYHRQPDRCHDNKG